MNPECTCGTEDLDDIEPEDHDADCPENPGNGEENPDE